MVSEEINAGLDRWVILHSIARSVFRGSWQCSAQGLQHHQIFSMLLLSSSFSLLKQTAPTDWYVFNDYPHHTLHTTVIYSL